MKQTASCRSLTLLKSMQSAECRLLELTLLLDKNPEDQTALRQYNETAERRSAMQQYLVGDRPFDTQSFPSFTAGRAGNWNRDSIS